MTTFGRGPFDALHFVASGFLVKDSEPAELAMAVRVVAQDDSLISPGMTGRPDLRDRHGTPKVDCLTGYSAARPCEIRWMRSGSLTVSISAILPSATVKPTTVMGRSRA